MPKILLVVLLALPASVRAAELVGDRGFDAALSALRAQTLQTWRASHMATSTEERETLLELLRDADPEVRRAAAKALKNYVMDNRVREAMLELARRSTEPDVRRGAILSLSAVISSETRDALSDIARRDPDPEMRQAAILAMDPGSEAIARYFHLARRTQSGRFIDPLEDE